MQRQYIISNADQPENSGVVLKQKQEFLRRFGETPNASVEEMLAEMGFDYKKTVLKWLRTDSEFRKKYKSIRNTGRPLLNPTDALRHAKMQFLQEFAKPDSTIASAAEAAGIPKSNAGAVNPDKQYTPLFEKWAKSDTDFGKEYQNLCTQKILELEEKHNLKILQKRLREYQKPVVTEAEILEIEKKKKDFLETYRRMFFSMTDACTELNIPKRTVQDWLEYDENFKDEFDNTYNEKRDLVESSLLKQVSAGSAPATIFAAKCLLKDRGYQEDTQIHHKIEMVRSKEEIDAIVRAAQLSQGVQIANTPGAKMLAQRIIDVMPEDAEETTE